MFASNDSEYVSCEWIEGGLAFNRRSVHACLIVHHNAGLPFIAPFKGGDLPIDRVLEERNRIRRANQTGGHPACTGCPHLRKQRWTEARYPFQILGIAHYSHCNLECNYCFLQTQDPRSFADGYRPYHLVPVIQKLIDTSMLAPGAIIDWGGGEPTAYREFEDLIIMLLEHGTTHWIHTNGTILPEAIWRTVTPERVHIICSIDAGLSTTYHLIKKSDLFERVWNNLAEYLRLGVNVTLKYIVLPENCDEENIRAFIERAIGIGAMNLILDVDYNQPAPVPEVIVGLARLKHLALRAGLHVQYGFTGDNFAPETAVVDRFEGAFRVEVLASIADLLVSRGYMPLECLDGSVEAVFEMFEAHCAEKDAEIRNLTDMFKGFRAQCAEKDAEILRLTEMFKVFRAQCAEKDAEILSLTETCNARGRVISELDAELYRRAIQGA